MFDTNGCTYWLNQLLWVQATLMAKNGFLQVNIYLIFKSKTIKGTPLLISDTFNIYRFSYDTTNLRNHES